MIPLEKVIDDMDSENSIVARGAKDYYYAHYATPEEQEFIRKKEQYFDFISKIMGVIVLIILFVCWAFII